MFSIGIQTMECDLLFKYAGPGPIHNGAIKTFKTNNLIWSSFLIEKRFILTIFFFNWSKNDQINPKKKIQMKIINLHGEDDGYLLHSCSGKAFKNDYSDTWIPQWCATRVSGIVLIPTASTPSTRSNRTCTPVYMFFFHNYYVVHTT